MLKAFFVDSLGSFTGMVLRMAVGEAEVEVARGADEWHQLLLLALGLVAAVREHLLLRLRLAVLKLRRLPKISIYYPRF